MLDFLDGGSGEWLPEKAYRETFGKDFWRINEYGFWKFERQQTFSEPGNDSWHAFAQGNWQEALRLIEVQRPDWESYFQRIAEHDILTRRVRVVEYPVAAYLHWELHLLRLEEQLGEEVSVIGSDRIERFEKSGPLPELVTLGSDVMYRIVYREDGALEGGIRFTDRDQVMACRKFIEDLYVEGEKLMSFFEREVATWEPPGKV